MIRIIALVGNAALIRVVSFLLTVERQDIRDTRWGKWLLVALLLTLALTGIVRLFYSTQSNLWLRSYFELGKADERRKGLKEVDQRMLEKSEERRKLEELEKSSKDGK